MHFCTNCQNMYYIRINADNPNKLVYYCRKCGNEDDTVVVDNTCVSKTFVKQEDNLNSFSHVINKYTKLDPTLPRVTNVTCPNQECSKKTKEIICIRYDDTHLKYVYLCSDCDTVWK